MDYGTGAVMAVPAHDQRDYEFATKYVIELLIESGLASSKRVAREHISNNAISVNGEKVSAALALNIPPLIMPHQLINTSMLTS